jgi:hypothetical protein
MTTTDAPNKIAYTIPLLLEVAKQLRPYGKKLPEISLEDACDLHSDLSEVLKVLIAVEQRLWERIVKTVETPR